MEDRKTVTVKGITGTNHIHREDLVVREAAVTLYLNETEMVTLICSPTDLRELCLGFLFAEGVIRSTQDIKSISLNQKDGLVWVETAQTVGAEKGFLKRHIASCCGRGRASFYFINDTDIKPVTSELLISTGDIVRLMAETEKRAALFNATGGAHGAALSDGAAILAFFEDVGRHNTLDKLAGWSLLNNEPARDKVLLFSGRVSSEVLVKTARLGVPVLVSRSAPTDLALELAEKLNVTVVGFARGQRMNVYTHGQRIS
ncbi:MAG: formate dehydrogenase accessory sulfurtransferase FdhD [Firmicutes bacterium]|nr:formate dehydrogenase accessory sulfurtransferase FdhD [Bacillota bacterium]